MDKWLQHPVIAAVREVKQVRKAALSEAKVIFLMTGDILSIDRCVKEAKARDKHIFLHVDLIKGLSNDKEVIKYVAKKVKPSGIVSTKGHLLQVAKQEGIYAVHHLFVIDTHAYQQGIRNVREIQPDAVEMMPGLMPRVIRDVRKHISCPIIAAGLISTKEEVEQALGAGAQAVAVSRDALWDYIP